MVPCIKTKQGAGMKVRHTIFLLILAVLFSQPAAAKYADGFVLGNFSYLRATSGFLPRVDSLAARMREAGYNATVCEIVDGSSPRQIEQLLGAFDRHGIDAILTDKVWRESGADPQFGTEALSIGNYWRFEAEYDSSSTLNQNAEKYFYIHSGRSGTATRSKQASNGWLRVLEDGQPGYALNRMEFRWPTAAHNKGIRYNIGPEFRFVQRAYGSGEKDDFTANPSADDTLYVTFAFNCSDLPTDPDALILRVSLAGFANQGDQKEREIFSYDPQTGKMIVPRELSVREYNSLPVANRNREGGKTWPHRELTLAIPVSSLYEEGLIDRTKGWRYSLLSLNPGFYWLGKGQLELDYVEFEDTMHRQLLANNALRQAVRERVQDLATSYDNISYLFLTDEPTVGQFSSYKEIEHGLLKDLDSLAPSLKGLISCSWLDRRNVLKDNGDNFNLISLFDEIAQPRILSFDIYPLFGSLRWNRPEVSRGIQKTLDMDMLKYYRTARIQCAKRGARFMPATQTYGVWLYDQQQWGTLRPPQNMQKCLQYLPLCYGAEGLINFKLYDVVGDPAVTKQTRQDFSPINVHEANGRMNLTFNSHWDAIVEANRRILAYARPMQSLEWIDSEAILTQGYRNPENLGSSGLKSLEVLPQNLVLNGISLYDGYVQAGLFRQKSGAPALMLVNRRTEFVFPQTSAASDGSDELLAVPPEKFDAACFPAPPQTVRAIFTASATRNLGERPGLWDPSDNSFYPLNGNLAEVAIGPGDGKLLLLVGSLPSTLNGRTKLEGRTLVNQDLQLAKGAKMSSRPDSELHILKDVTIAKGASLKLRGKVHIADGVQITVLPGGKIDLKKADCTWGKGAELVRN